MRPSSRRRATPRCRRGAMDEEMGLPFRDAAVPRAPRDGVAARIHQNARVHLPSRNAAAISSGASASP